MAATKEGVWDLQEARDKQLQSEWDYSAPGDPASMWALGGDNVYGALGQNDRTQRSSPVQIGTDVGWDQMQQGDAAAQYMSYAIKEGALWAWGRNDYGELGQNDRTKYSSPVQIPGTTWTCVAEAQDGSVLATKSDNTLWAWGFSGMGQAGQGTTDDHRSSPTQVPGQDGATWKATPGKKADLADRPISCGYGSVYAIGTNGQLYAWGGNGYGQLGQSSKTSRNAPYEVTDATTWKSVSAGHSWAMATKTDGTLWALGGANSEGPLGQNNRTEYSSPRLIGTETTWTRIYANRYNGNGFKSDGTLWVWGANTGGGNGQNLPTSSHRSSPVQLPAGTGLTWDAYSIGDDGARTATKSNGTLWGWGYNGYGQLGLNNRTDYSSPTQVGTDTNWVDTTSSRTRGFGFKQ